MFQTIEKTCSDVGELGGLKAADKDQRFELIICERLQIEALAFSIDDTNVGQEVVGLVHDIMNIDHPWRYVRIRFEIFVPIQFN